MNDERGQRSVVSRQWYGGVIASALLLALGALGCSEPTIGVVSGRVTVDGVPAKSGSIAFFPVDGKSPTAGAEIVEGQYRAEVPPGVSRIEIRVPKVVGEKKLYDTPDSPLKPLLAESLPGPVQRRLGADARRSTWREPARLRAHDEVAGR